MVGSILAVWPWESHSTSQGLSFFRCIIDKIMEEILALFKDFSEQLELSMLDQATLTGHEFPITGSLQAAWYLQASVLRGML